MGLYQLQIKVNRFLNWIYRGKIYVLKNGEVGINLGCETRTIPSFVGIDGSFLIYFMKNKLIPKSIKKKLYQKTSSVKQYSFENFMERLGKLRIIHHNLNYGIPFEAESMRFIFTSNFLEHLIESDARKLLKECFRILKKGGVIRIIVPDLEEEIETMEKDISNYRKNKNIGPLQKYLTPCFAPEGEFATHKIIYNFEMLKKILTAAKFKNIKRMKKFEGNFPDLKKLESISEKGMIIEAEK